MTTLSGKLNVRTPTLLLDAGASAWNDFSAKEYLSNLTRYLKNVTISFSRPRPSDLIPLDGDAGLVWLVAIPIVYFAVVILILGLLLLCFWYVDRTGVVSDAQSEASAKAAAMSGMKQDNAMTNIKHDTVVVGEAKNSPHQSIFRSYLINTEYQDILRMSDASKGSTRSLGVLTETDLQVLPKMSTSIRSQGFAPVGRRTFTSIQECSGHDVGGSDRKYTPRTFSRVRSIFRTPQSSDVDLNVADVTVSSGNNSSFSTDSLEERTPADSLRISMESHKNVCTARGEIGPGDLYESHRIVPGIKERRIVKDVNMNQNTESKIDQKFIFPNQMFTDDRMRHTDDHLKEAYEDALSADKLNADKLNFYYRTFENVCSKSIFPSIHFPQHELLELHRSELPRFRNDYTFSNDNSEVFAETRQEHSIKMTGRMCQKIYPGSYPNAHNKTNTLNGNPIRTRLFKSDSSVDDSQMSSTFLTEERIHSPSDRRCSNYQNDYSLVSIVLSDEEEEHQKSSHQHKDNFRVPDEDIADFEISPVSQITVSPREDLDISSVSQIAESPRGDFDMSSVSQIAESPPGYFDNSHDSLGSVFMRPDEGSLNSANNSLPSSIARFHAGNVGQCPSPCAGYPLSSEADFDNSRSDCPCEDCRYNRTTRSSLSVNFGSCGESTAAGSRAVLSQDNSSRLSQNDTDCDQELNKLNQGLVKLSKRPSPLSNLVNNIRQRYSFDENCLKSRREASDEEEALLLTPLLQNDFGSTFKKHHTLDSKPRKVSVEERLHEYGFLKCKGKNKYVINPLPGKFETGIGYCNHVFANTEEVCETSKHGREHGNKQSFTSQFHFSASDSVDDGHLSGISQSILKSPLSQHRRESASIYQYSPFMDGAFYRFSESQFSQEEEIPVAEPNSGTSQENLAVFEAHCGDDWLYPSNDLKQAECKVNKIAREIGHCASSLSDNGVTIFKKQNVNLASPGKNVHNTPLFSREPDFPGNEKFSCAGLPKLKTQTGTYENNQIGTCGKTQTGKHEKTQNGMYENTQTRKYENNHKGIYENTVTENCENIETDKHEKPKLHVINTLEFDNLPTSSDINNVRPSLKNTTGRETNSMYSNTSVSNATIETSHKLKRQYTSRTLLSLGNGFSRDNDRNQDRENGILNSPRLYHIHAGSLQAIESMDIPRC